MLTSPVAAPALLYEERLGMPRRAWGLFGLALLTTVVAVHPLAVIPVVLSWGYSVVRFNRSTVRISPDWFMVGKRMTPLAGLDLRTIGRARNPWPWKVFSRRFLGANPIWTADSIRIVGQDLHGEQVVIAVGTNHRDQLLAVLHDAVQQSYSRLAQRPYVAPAAPPPDARLVGLRGPTDWPDAPPIAGAGAAAGSGPPGLPQPWAAAPPAPGSAPAGWSGRPVSNAPWGVPAGSPGQPPIVGAPQHVGAARPGVVPPAAMHPGATPNWPGAAAGGWVQPAPVRPPGWYDDPWAPGASWRWWDGARWTTDCAPAYGRGPYG
jgi:hypothetical protein